MTTWSGFTDRELARLKGSGPPKKDASLTAGSKQRKPSYKSVVKTKNSENGDQVRAPARDVGYVDTGPCDSSETSLEHVSAASKASGSRPSSLTSDTGPPSPAKESLASPEATSPCKPPHTPTNVQGDVDSIQLEEQPKVNLDALHKKQKEMEEENLKKKSLLHKAIAERYQKTATEANILNSVQAELNKLDLMLSNDVHILRERIELANRDFETARKRFESAEKEYVSAKISLHKASEDKELLAEHLYTIIQQNELRKASRLNDLMSKLHLDRDPEAGSEPLSPSSGSEAHSLGQPLHQSVVQRTPTPAIAMSQVSKGLGMLDHSKTIHPLPDTPSTGDLHSKGSPDNSLPNSEPCNEDPSNNTPSDSVEAPSKATGCTTGNDTGASTGESGDQSNDKAALSTSDNQPS